MTEQGKAGLIYFLRAGSEGCVKIGWSGSDVDLRSMYLQIGCPEDYQLLGTVSGTQSDEADWHVRFDYAHRRGEWFWPVKELLAAIQAEQPPAPAPEPAPEFVPEEHPNLGLIAINDRLMPFMVWMSVHKVSLRQLAEKAGVALETMEAELQGRIPISETTAKRIETATGGKVAADYMLNSPAWQAESAKATAYYEEQARRRALLEEAA